MSEERKNRRGDRYDAWLVRGMDPMQGFMNYVMGTRTENEAVIHIDIPMENLGKFVAEKNANNPNPIFKYTFLHVVLAALARTIEARPKMNYFVRNRKFWERKVISFSFIAKKQKIDGAEEGLVITNYKKDSDISPLEQMHNSTCKMVSEIREKKESQDDTTKIMAGLLKLPGFILKPVVKLILHLDRVGKLPKSFVKANPYGCTCFLSNLGSIKMDASYHHLINFGTNSIFGIIGKKKKLPVYTEENGEVKTTLKEFLPVSLTVDERIADGVYYAKTVRILTALLIKPELLELPAREKIDYEKLLEEVDV
ncbi:MAG: 2-oxo acid dehydrogenase subunit E2 [Sphaerochaetaceae bacterium]|nr:2-oxo acid dehydrogenase subunit E2 [Sphaerochaetaceae bacterium]